MDRDSSISIHLKTFKIISEKLLTLLFTHDILINVAEIRTIESEKKLKNMLTQNEQRVILIKSLLSDELKK